MTDIKKIKAEVRAEMEKELVMLRQNQRTFTKVMSEFENEFKKFNWEEKYSGVRPWDGSVFSGVSQHNEAYKVRNALGTLVRAAFKEKNIAGISSEKEDQLRQITRKILNIISSEILEESKEA